MSKAKKKKNLLGVFVVIAAFLLLVLIGSVIPYEAAVEPETIGSSQKFVEWAVRTKEFIIDNIYLLLIIIGVTSVGYLNVNSKK